MAKKVYAMMQIIHLDELFNKTPGAKLFNNQIVHSTAKEILDKVCEISADTSELVAVCECRTLRGDHYEGIICKKCETECTSLFANIIKNDLWLEIPNSIGRVLNPQVYHILDNWLGKYDKVPILDMLLNVNVSVPEELSIAIPGQGFHYFHNNFEAIIKYFAFIYPKVKSKPKTPMILQFLDDNIDRIWTSKLPIVSKMLQPITETGSSNQYTDKSVAVLMRAIIDYSSTMLAEMLSKTSRMRVERNLFTIYKAFMTYTSDIIRTKLAKKEGILRKHLYGARLHCTGRSVCIPITVEHDGDEVFLPWVLGVSMWKYHIISMLVNRYHHTVADAYSRVQESLTVYDHKIDIILQLLVKESPYKGLPIILNRNPSLRLGAIQLLFVTRIKPAFKDDPTEQVEPDFLSDDVEILDNQHSGAFEYKLPFEAQRQYEDKTIAVSNLILAGPNIDFDGDELNLMPVYESEAVERLMVIHPSQRMISNDKLEIAGGDVSLSDQLYIMLSGYTNASC